MKRVKKYLDKNLEGMVESHLMVWFATQYLGKSKDIIKLHIKTHDDSLEIEEVQEELKRELSSNEEAYLIDRFHNAVIEAMEYNNNIAIGFWDTLEQLIVCGGR